MGHYPKRTHLSPTPPQVFPGMELPPGSIIWAQLAPKPLPIPPLDDAGPSTSSSADITSTTAHAASTSQSPSTSVEAVADPQLIPLEPGDVVPEGSVLLVKLPARPLVPYVDGMYLPPETLFYARAADPASVDPARAMGDGAQDGAGTTDPTPASTSASGGQEEGDDQPTQLAVNGAEAAPGGVLMTLPKRKLRRGKGVTTAASSGVAASDVSVASEAEGATGGGAAEEHVNTAACSDLGKATHVAVGSNTSSTPVDEGQEKGQEEGQEEEQGEVEDMVLVQLLPGQVAPTGSMLFVQLPDAVELIPV